MTNEQQKQQTSQTARDILSIFFFKKHVFIVTFVTVMVSALLVSFLFPPIYVVNAQLVIKPKIETPMVFDKEISRVNVDNRVDIQMINTVIQLIRSPELLRTVVDKHGLAKDNTEKEIQKAVGKLAGQVTVEPLALSNMISITLKGGDRYALPDILSSLIDAYISYHIQINQTSLGSMAFFNEQADNYKQEFDDITNHLASQSGARLVANPMLQKEHILKLIKDLEVERSEIIMEISSLRETIMILKKAKNNLMEGDQLVALPLDIMQRFPALEEMEKSLAQLIINRQRAHSDYYDSAKQVKDADRQYNNMKSQISHHIEKLIDSLDSTLLAKHQDQIILNEEIDKGKQSLREITEAAIEMERLQLEHKLAKENYTLYNTKKEEARINLEKDKALFANVSIASRPVPPMQPWFPQKRKMLILAFPLAIFLALGMSAGFHAMDQRLMTPYDIISKIRAPYLGSLDDMASV
jgi:polysaccharide biosynthesis protein PslE